MKNIIGANAGNVAAPSVKYLEVGDDGEGQRLDNYLLRVLKGVPKTHVYRIIRSGEVRINKGRAQADSRLQPGDVVRVPPVRVASAVPSSRPKPRRRVNFRHCSRTSTCWPSTSQQVLLCTAAAVSVLA